MKTLIAGDNPSLSSLDLSPCTKLVTVDVGDDGLTSLDTSALTALATLDASGNKLKFSTVTQPDGFTGGNYSNQDNDPIEIANPVKAGQEIDLSAEYVDGRSVYTWNPTVDFTCANGIISFGDNARGKNITGTITCLVHRHCIVRTRQCHIFLRRYKRIVAWQKVGADVFTLLNRIAVIDAFMRHAAA